MNTRSSRMKALIGAAIMIISAGCSAANGATSAAVSPPEEADVTVAAIPAVDVSAIQAIMAQNDKLPPPVTAAMALPATYPVGPVAQASIQRVATAMLTFGVLGPQYAARVRQGTLVRSMIVPGS